MVPPTPYISIPFVFVKLTYFSMRGLPREGGTDGRKEREGSKGKAVSCEAWNGKWSLLGRDFIPSTIAMPVTGTYDLCMCTRAQRRRGEGEEKAEVRKSWHLLFLVHTVQLCETCIRHRCTSAASQHNLTELGYSSNTIIPNQASPSDIALEGKHVQIRRREKRRSDQTYTQCSID